MYHYYYWSVGHCISALGCCSVCICICAPSAAFLVASAFALALTDCSHLGILQPALCHESEFYLHSAERFIYYYDIPIRSRLFSPAAKKLRLMHRKWRELGDRALFRKVSLPQWWKSYKYNGCPRLVVMRLRHSRRVRLLIATEMNGAFLFLNGRSAILYKFAFSMHYASFLSFCESGFVWNILATKVTIFFPKFNTWIKKTTTISAVKYYICVKTHCAFFNEKHFTSSAWTNTS